MQKNKHQNHQSITQTQRLCVLCMCVCVACLISCSNDESMLPPQCVPGKVESCPCINSGKGTQVCSNDGRRYLQCQCSTTQDNSFTISRFSKSKTTSPPSNIVEKPKTPTVQKLPTQRKNHVKKQGKLLTKLIKDRDERKRLERSQIESNRLKNTSLPATVLDKKNDVLEEKKHKKQIFVSSSTSTHPQTSKPTKKSIDHHKNKIKQDSNSSNRKDVTLSTSKSVINYSNEPVPPARSKRNQRMRSQLFWFFSEALETCVLASDVNGVNYSPSTMLAGGCYQKSREAGRMRIKCEDPPLGPRVFEYMNTRELCLKDSQQNALSANIKNQSSLKSATLPRSTHRSTPSEYHVKKKKKTSKSKEKTHHNKNSLKTWYCICYQERYHGKVENSTACRPTQTSCRDLEEKIKTGSHPLIANSTSVSCSAYFAHKPWDRFGLRYHWLPSNHPGAWWTPRGCFLKEKKFKKRKSSTSRSRSSSKKRVQRRSKKRSRALPKKVTSINKPKPKTQSSTTCDMTCWAHLADSKDRQKRFGQSSVPKELMWGQFFAERVKLIVRTCVARRRAQRQDPTRSKTCFKEGVKACARFCERSKGKE